MPNDGVDVDTQPLASALGGLPRGRGRRGGTRDGHGRGTRGRGRAQGRDTVTLVVSDSSESEETQIKGNLPESEPESVNFEQSDDSDAAEVDIQMVDTDRPQHCSAPASSSSSSRHVSKTSSKRVGLPREPGSHERSSMWDLSTVWAGNIAVVRRSDTPVSGST